MENGEQQFGESREKNNLYVYIGEQCNNAGF